MLTLKTEKGNFSIKNKLEEFTIDDFEIICSHINNDKISNIERWQNIFIFLSVPQDIVEEMDISDFITAINHFELDIADNTPQKQVIINDICYTSYDDELKFTVREMNAIETYIQKNKTKYIGELMAVLFKQEGIEKSMWYNTSHIDYKAKLFRKNITADVALPFLGLLGKKIIKNFELLTPKNVI